ncbi:ATP-binding protein [Halohasta litchfieldiae]|uniref:ATP-binding protein n=1 Tax=Halohasta litchfieldiae TaxID=1073996 RepID=UPI0013A599C0|nr:ATP-binding protein [Halohasta litchfieldiae]
MLEDGYTTDADGTGLGLAIVEQIADAHGWTVSVTDSHTGGARFEIGNISKEW